MTGRAGHTGNAKRQWLLALAALLLFAFVGLAVATRTGSALQGWDQHVTDAFVAWRSSGWSRAFWVLTLLGDDPLMGALSAALVVLLVMWGKRTRAAVIAVALLVSWGLMNLAKEAVGRARPSEAVALIAQPGSNSMPSGHALVSLVFWGLLVCMLVQRLDARGLRETAGGGASSRRATVLKAAVKSVLVVGAVVLAAAIGVSRVYLGVHWASDVVAGWCLGGAFLLVALRSATLREKRSRPGIFADRELGGGKGARALGVAALVVVLIVVVLLTARADPLL